MYGKYWKHIIEIYNFTFAKMARTNLLDFKYVFKTSISVQQFAFVNKVGHSGLMSQIYYFKKSEMVLHM